MNEQLKHGSWKPIVKQHGNATDGYWTEKYLQCSVCNYERQDVFIPKYKPPYCEECGADMRGDNCNEFILPHQKHNLVRMGQLPSSLPAF